MMAKLKETPTLYQISFTTINFKIPLLYPNEIFLDSNFFTLKCVFTDFLNILNLKIFN